MRTVSTDVGKSNVLGLLPPLQKKKDLRRIQGRICSWGTAILERPPELVIYTLQFDRSEATKVRKAREVPKL